MNQDVNESSQSGVDADPYCLKNVPLFEAIYGKHLISLGGLDAIDDMFSGLNVNGLNALDLGFGLGGVAYYLAEHYQMSVSGIEMYLWMAQYATEHAPPNIADALDFQIYNAAGKTPYDESSFDLVYSKGVLNHVNDKEALFHQINALLKPEGLFVIADWLFPEVPTDNSGPLVCETKQTYTQVLTKTGFHELEFRDDSSHFLNHAKDLLENMTAQQVFIEEIYGREIFSLIWEQHQKLIKDLNQHKKQATRIVAKKSAE